jgi:hypothetical protein
MSFIPPISQPPGRPYGEASPRKGTTESELGEGGEHRRQLAASGASHRPWWKRIFGKGRRA